MNLGDGHSFIYWGYGLGIMVFGTSYELVSLVCGCIVSGYLVKRNEKGDILMDFELLGI